jgi:ABC-2 type transport system permease protein
MMRALIGKDLLLFFRNQFFAVITLLGLAAFIAVYYLLPGAAQDTVATALVLPGEAQTRLGGFLSEAMESDLLSSENELVDSVTRGDYVAGVVLEDDLIAAMERGERVAVPVYLAPGVSSDLRTAVEDIYTVGLNNINVADAARQVDIRENLTVLGADFLGIRQPIALRDRMLPLLLLLVFSVELMGMANLISEEVETGTVCALLVTPLGLIRFFLGKLVVGLGLAFTQVLILVAAAGKLDSAPLIVLTTLFIGGFMVTGLAFLVASFARNLMSVLAWSTLFLLLLILPGMSMVFPVMAAPWIRLIPSYFLVDSLHRVFNYGAGWREISTGLHVLLASGMLLLAVGSGLLYRRFK